MRLANNGSGPSGPGAGLLAARYRRCARRVRRQAEKFQDVVLDSGAKDGEALRMALVVADTVLVPVLPRAGLGKMAALVEVATAAWGNLRALAVLNLADPGSSPDDANASAAGGDFPALTLPAGTIRERKASAAARGLLVEELATYSGDKTVITVTISAGLLDRVDEVARQKEISQDAPVA